jgi:hypothetical protein
MSLNSVKELFFAMETICVFSEVITEFLNTIYMSFWLYSSLSQSFYPGGTLEIISRSQGTPA